MLTIQTCWPFSVWEAGERRSRGERALRSDWQTTYQPAGPGYALSLGDALAQAGLRAGRTFDLGNGQAARDRQLAAGSPVLAALLTDVDTAYDWLMAGQALAHVLLYARSQGVWASFFNQPIEVPEVRLMLHHLIERGYPQMLLRMGYGPHVPPTPRRNVCEVLL